MSWSVGWDSNWHRDIGYGVPAYCDHPECSEEIHRGLSYVCGGQPYGGERGCGLYFCAEHLHPCKTLGDCSQLCPRCYRGRKMFSAKQDHVDWISWKLQHPSWQAWREENSVQAAILRQQLSGVDRFGRVPEQRA